MKVKDLIAELQKQDQEAEVFYWEQWSRREVDEVTSDGEATEVFLLTK